MLLYENPSYTRLPTAEELPYSDDSPVESELQDKIVHLLLEILNLIWESRNDWFFGIDMGLYYQPNTPAIVPDGFLSLGVQRVKAPYLRLSYVIWEENGVIPMLAVEVVSKTPGGEYKRKKKEYARIGVKYYVIYAPRRRRKPRFTIYKLEKGKYRPLEGNPVWLPEVGLGIGTGLGSYQGLVREWLYWYDEEGSRYATQAETTAQERAMRQTAELRVEQLAARLIALGIDPDDLGQN
ncbi:MAG: Uma2 family endonuclease [Hormoscilla sp. GUM202]|nr:Uma2 family endonuclease [Hormoscilla sp. GUM202]